MTGERFDGQHTGPCAFCGRTTIMRARIQRSGWWRRLLHGNAPLRWACPPCTFGELDRLTRRGR